MSRNVNRKFFRATSPLGGANLRFLSHQPDISLHCQTTDTEGGGRGLVHRAVCLFETGTPRDALARALGCLRPSFRWYSLHLPTK